MPQLPQSLGWLIALAVLVVAIILLVSNRESLEWALALIGALAVSRLVP